MKKINSIFEWLNEITLYKTPVNQIDESSWDNWNSYMIHRFISQKIEYLEFVNFVQKFNPQEKQQIYQIYCEFMPKQKTYFKYQKSNHKPSNKELIEIFSDYFELSEREIHDYIKILNKEDKTEILNLLGYDKKSITKLLKQ